MSIDARVANTYRDGPDLVIELIPSAPGAVAGADSLRVLNTHWDRPPAGTLLWGNSTVLMTSRNVSVYTRYDGPGYLRENDENPPPWQCKGPPFHPNCQCG